MPKKLKVSSNQRVDLVDFNRASSEYTADSDSFHRKNLWLSKYSSVLNGFRIEIADQATNPGEFTIFNGISIDKTGALLNNEDQIDDSRTVTLTGTGAKFYIEIEFVESESDVDVRAFWDPTFAGNDPLGREFTQNVSTRLSPDWKVSTPISTTEFSSTSDVNSSAVPIAILYTNNFNEIVGFTPVNAATVLEKDAESADTMLYVLDSTLLPASGTVTVGGTSVSIVDNDRANGILTISAPLGVAKKIGDIVVETGSTAAFLPESSEAVPGDPGATSSGDQRRVFFKGDENRGSAFSVNPEDAASRSDSQIKSLKDYVDFLSAQIRELKFGSLRSDEFSSPPPSDFTSTRYFDRVGSVSGSRSFSMTIGDGAYSFGDINDSNLATALSTAVSALDSTRGGSIYVKEGDYTWSGTPSLNKPLTLVFNEGATFVAGTYGGSIDLTDKKTKIVGFPDISNFLNLTLTVDSNTGSDILIEESNFGSVIIAGSSSGVNLVAKKSTFRGDNTSSTITSLNTDLNDINKIVFEDCTISYKDSVDGPISYLLYWALRNMQFINCNFDIAESSGSAAGFLSAATGVGLLCSDLKFINCKFTETNTGKADLGLSFAVTALDGELDNITIKDCIFDFNWNPAIASPPKVISFGPAALITNCVVDGCDFTAMSINGFPGSSDANKASIVNLQCLDISNPQKVNVGNRVVNNTFGKNDFPTTPTDFCTFVYAFADGIVCDLLVSGNHFNTFNTAVNILGTVKATITSNKFTYKTFINYNQHLNAIEFRNTFVAQIVDSNEFFIESRGTDNSKNCYGISVVEQSPLGSTGRSDIVITGNNMYMTATTVDDLSCINVLLTGSSILSGLTISGNSLYSGCSAGSVYSVYIDSLSDSSSFLVNNNNIEVEAYSNFLTFVRGINLDTSGDQKSNIVGNTITVKTSSLSAESLNLIGIRVDGSYVGIYSNNIDTFYSGNQTGISVDNGSFIDIKGNIIKQNWDITQSDGSTTLSNAVFVQGTADGKINITNNDIRGSYKTRWLVYFEHASSGFRGLNISDNLLTMQSNVTLAECLFIHINSLGPVNSIRGVKINNNTLIEDTAESFVNTGGIKVECDTLNAIDGLTISNNNIIGRVDLASAPKGPATTGANTGTVTIGGISVIGGNRVSVTGNCISNWGNTTYPATSIDLFECSSVAVVGNVVSPSVWNGATGAFAIIVGYVGGTATRGVLVANSAAISSGGITPILSNPEVQTANNDYI